jgi:hypothetical protein
MPASKNLHNAQLSENARHRDQLAMFRTLDFAVVRQFDFASPLP